MHSHSLSSVLAIIAPLSCDYLRSLMLLLLHARKKIGGSLGGVRMVAVIVALNRNFSKSAGYCD